MINASHWAKQRSKVREHGLSLPVDFLRLRPDYTEPQAATRKSPSLDRLDVAEREGPAELVLARVTLHQSGHPQLSPCERVDWL